MRVELTDLQRELLLELHEAGIISFTEARDRGSLRHYRDLKVLKLVDINQHGIVITTEGRTIAFRKTPTL